MAVGRRDGRRWRRRRGRSPSAVTRRQPAARARRRRSRGDTTSASAPEALDARRSPAAMRLQPVRRRRVPMGSGRLRLKPAPSPPPRLGGVADEPGVVAVGIGMDRNRQHVPARPEDALRAVAVMAVDVEHRDPRGPRVPQRLRGQRRVVDVAMARRPARRRRGGRAGGRARRPTAPRAATSAAARAQPAAAAAASWVPRADGAGRVRRVPPGPPHRLRRGPRRPGPASPARDGCSRPPPRPAPGMAAHSPGASRSQSR